MKQQLNKLLITSSVLLALSACGGSSGNDSNDTPINDNGATNDNVATTPSAANYRVIDGYLSAADVCVIRQGNTNCESIGSTDENGLISVPSDITAGKIVATAIAGKTKDSDSVGFVARSYQMVAEISSDTPNVITPFTTIDVLDDTKSMADIASELNLPESLLNGDYIASEEPGKFHVHTLARGIAAQLSSSKDENDILTLNTQLSAMNEYINTDLANSNVDLNSVNIFIDGDSVTHENAIRQLADFLESGDVYVGSINSAFFAREGVMRATFNSGQVTVNGQTASYEINGEQLIMTVGNEQETDLFLYASADFALSVPVNNKDLTVLSHTVLNPYLFDTWKENDFAGQTYYLLFDDAPYRDTTPKPTMVKLIFSESTVQIIEGNQSLESPWRISFGDLNIDMLEAGVGDINLAFSKIISEKNITIIRDLNKGLAISLMFTEESLAQTIFEKWKGV